MTTPDMSQAEDCGKHEYTPPTRDKIHGLKPPPVPEHVMSLLIGLPTPPEGPPGAGPDTGQWLAHVRRVAMSVWCEAWLSGAAAGLAYNNQPIQITGPAAFDR